MQTHAQIDGNGIAVAITDQPIGIPCEWSDIGKRWDGAQFVAVQKTRTEEINEALAVIDKKSGMPRLLRETLMAIGGAAVPGILKTHESNAASLRAELAAIK